MKTWKRLLAALMCAVLLTACGDTEPVPEPEEDPTPAFVNITSAGESDYYVIRSDNATDRSEVDAAVTIRKEINTATGASLGISTDWEKNPVYEHEIIVGKTLRDGCEIDTTALGRTGYIIKEVDGDIYICGGAAPGIRLAVEYFLQEFVKEGSDVVIPTGFERIVYHQFEIPELYINMNLVNKNWKIVIPESQNPKIEQMAERLQTSIAGKCGFALPIVTGDESTPNAFILSETKPEMGGVHTMHVDDDRLIFRSSASTGITGCVQRFIDLYLSGNTRGKFNFPGDFEYLDLGDFMIVTYPDTK